jgi:hypothetical protein
MACFTVVQSRTHLTLYQSLPTKREIETDLQLLHMASTKQQVQARMRALWLLLAACLAACVRADSTIREWNRIVMDAMVHQRIGADAVRVCDVERDGCACDMERNRGRLEGKGSGRGGATSSLSSALPVWPALRNILPRALSKHNDNDLPPIGPGPAAARGQCAGGRAHRLHPPRRAVEGRPGRFGRARHHHHGRCAWRLRLRPLSCLLC